MSDEISALMDGELDEQESASLIGRLKEQDALQERWHLYHLIGDAIQDPEGFRAQSGFDLSERLRQEPTILAPARESVRTPKVRLYALSAAASIAAVFLVGWVAARQGADPAAPVAIQARAVQVEAHANDYLAAHQEIAEMPEMLSHIRTVSESSGEIRR